MIFISYKQNSGGRSGHKLCDIFTCFIFQCLLNINVLYHESWKDQLILSEKSLKKHTYSFTGKFDHIENINGWHKWECLSWEDFNSIKQKIIQLNKDKNILIRLSNVVKIHPHIIYYWYVKKYINEDIYNNKILPTLRKIYYDDHNNIITDCISIHVRCGDLYHRLKKDIGFTFDYYNNIINTLNLYFNIKINIFCENSNSHDIKKLKGIKNVHLHIGNKNDFITHFNCMVNSKVLIVSPSSMSLFASYICKGLVLIDNKSINWRPNVFHSYNLIEKFNNIEEKIDLIKNVFWYPKDCPPAQPCGKASPPRPYNPRRRPPPRGQLRGRRAPWV